MAIPNSERKTPPSGDIGLADDCGWRYKGSEEVRIGGLALAPTRQSDGPGCLTPEVTEAIRRQLIEQESAYRQKPPEETCSSLWAHSLRVSRIAQHIAIEEGFEQEPALLAGLMHDMGKFVDGCYHEDDIPEERHAARFVERILAKTIFERWIPVVREAILSMCLEGDAVSDTGCVVYDADCLDKLGNIGVAQFFAKKALRRQFLDEDVMIRASVELTYARHAPDTLKTATGRDLARERSARTRRFYTELLDEWSQLGLGDFDIVTEDIAGVDCVLVVSGGCPCGGRLKREADIRDTIKCRALVVAYRCEACGAVSEFSFCLPNVKGLPQKR
jgi:uncharacterized protein